MKRLKIILLFLVICISCFGQNRTRTNTSTNTNNTTSQRVTWEYKIISSNNHYNDDDTKEGPWFISNQELMLNKMGIEGWELVSTYTEIATAFPNFDWRDNYISGIRSNTRTTVINFVFKRPKSGK
jgi:hypothetical protein